MCDVAEREDGGAVAVAYGTSQGLQRHHKGEFAITKRDHRAAYNSAGLSFDTKFDLRQSIELSWNENFFSPCLRGHRMASIQSLAAFTPR